MTKKERIAELLRRLDEHYTTDLTCYLDHANAWQLLMATILSAQCTDARVNLVTKILFAHYQGPEEMAKAELRDVERDVQSTGFYHNKAKNLIACSQVLVEKYGGEVPNNIDALTELPGVGRKTANVIRGNIYHEPSIVVDTHVKRISHKLGLAKAKEPEKIEQELMKVLPVEHWILYNIQIIAHGRSICPARNPHCEECFLSDLCKAPSKKGKKP